MPKEFPLSQSADMVHKEIGLDGLTEALGQVLDARVRGRILVRPRG
jgi:hypothetical protein